MAKVKTKIKRIYTSNDTPIERKYFLAQAVAGFSGVLILIPIINQNINDHGYTIFNDLTIGVTISLGLLSLIFCYSAFFNHPKQMRKLARLVLKSNWGAITILFFYFTWVMNVFKLITSKIGESQIWIVVILGFTLFIASV